jgi:transcriptional regulator with XRE-family HTH domain
MSPERFALRLKEIRHERGLTQAQLAQRVGVSAGYMARLEMGRHDPPLSRLRSLAKALKVTVGELVD